MPLGTHTLGSDRESKATTLTGLLDRFEKQRDACSRFIGQFAKEDPTGFLEAALAFLKRGGDGPAEQYLVRFLRTQGNLLKLLTDPAGLHIDEAVHLACVWRPHISDLDVLLAKTLKGASIQEAERILHILGYVTENNRILPLLMPLMEHSSERIRQKAVLIFGKFCQSSIFAKVSLRNSDSRIRANAVEGLWRVNAGWAADALLEALEDPNNRVAANAALGLYKRGHKDGRQPLVRMAAHSKAAFRASAAWAMGETRDEDFLPALELLKGNTEEIVVRNAVTGIDKIKHCGKSRAASQRKSGKSLENTSTQTLIRAGVHGDSTTKGASKSAKQHSRVPPRKSHPVLSKEQLMSILKQYMMKAGEGYAAWYVGVCRDPRERLFKEHRVVESGEFWLYRRADNPETAEAVEDVFVNWYGAEGRPGTEENPTYVYAYKKAPGTDP